MTTKNPSPPMRASVSLARKRRLGQFPAQLGIAQDQRCGSGNGVHGLALQCAEGPGTGRATERQ